MRYILCSCEGFKHVATKDIETIKFNDNEVQAGENLIRRRVSNRAACRAKIVIKTHSTGEYTSMTLKSDTHTN